MTNISSHNLCLLAFYRVLIPGSSFADVVFSGVRLVMLYFFLSNYSFQSQTHIFTLNKPLITLKVPLTKLLVPHQLIVSLFQLTLLEPLICVLLFYSPFCLSELFDSSSWPTQTPSASSLSSPCPPCPGCTPKITLLVS